MLRFVLMHLPGKITYKEIDEMIATVDKNEDWKISYSEFRVSFFFFFFRGHKIKPRHMKCDMGPLTLLIWFVPPPSGKFNHTF